MAKLEHLDRQAFVDGEPAVDDEIRRGVESGSVLVVDAGPDVIGYVQWADHGSVRHVSGLVTAPGHRGRGVARTLLRSALASMHPDGTAELTTAPTNVAMLRLACSEQFRGERHIDDAFGPGSNRVLLRRVPLPCPIMPGSTFHVPVTSPSSLKECLNGHTVLTGVIELPHGPAWRMSVVDEATVVTARANESSVAVGFASVVLGAIAFLLGFGLASESYPADLLAALSVALVASLTSMLVYANTTGELTSLQFGSFNRAMSVGNILSEFGGVYPVYHIVPVSLAAITGSTSAGLIACVGSSIAALTYQLSPFDILDRYRDNAAVFGAMVAWLVTAPIIGYASYVLADSTLVWSILDITILAGIATYCLKREEGMRTVQAC